MHLPFLGGSLTGEVRRRANGQPHPLTSESGGLFLRGRAVGGSAWRPTGGDTAEPPSNPGQVGGMVCPILAGGLLTASDDGSGGTVDDGWLPGERGPTRASGRRAAGGSGADGGTADGGGWSADKFFCLFW